MISRNIQNSPLPTEYIEWISLCLKSGYFVWREEFYLQVDGVAMGSPIAPVVANIFMEWYESLALSTAHVKPRYWWRYVDDIFAIIDKEGLSGFTDHLNNLHHKISITVEEEKEGVLPFLDVRVIRMPDNSLTHTIHRKPTHTDRYLHASSHHHPAHLSSVPRALMDRALRLCDPPYIQKELQHVRGVLEDNGYSWRQCCRWAKTSERKRPTRVERSPAYLPFVRGITDKIGYLLRRKYDIRTFFRPPGQIRQMLRSPKDKDRLNVPGVYKVPCDCGKSYVGETRRNIATRLTEHIRSIKNMDITKSALAEHAHLLDSNHYIRFDKASVLAREKFYVPRKIREAIEINRHPNFNRDGGWTLPPAWIPTLNVTSTQKLSGSLESDTVSFVCHGTCADDDDEITDDEVGPPSSAGHARTSSPSTSSAGLAPPPPSSPLPPPAPVSSRAARAALRSARRELADAAAHSP